MSRPAAAPLHGASAPFRVGLGTMLQAVGRMNVSQDLFKITSRNSEAEMKSIVAFMKWERLVPWKVFSLQEYPSKPLVPIGFGARFWEFYNRIEPKSQIWVVTDILNQHSLAARITVQQIIDGNSMPEEQWSSQAARLLKIWRFVATADVDNSEFFETNNAAPVLRANEICFNRNRTLIYREESLEDMFKMCMEQGRNTVFISYRWREAKIFAKALAKELRSQGFSPWLDALALPEYEIARESEKDAPRLNRLIRSGIERSKYAIVINTKTYGESYWTQLEQSYLNEFGIPKFYIDARDTQETNGKKYPKAKSPKNVIREFLNQIPPTN